MPFVCFLFVFCLSQLIFDIRVDLWDEHFSFSLNKTKQLCCNFSSVFLLYPFICFFIAISTLLAEIKIGQSFGKIFPLLLLLCIILHSLCSCFKPLLFYVSLSFSLHASEYIYIYVCVYLPDEKKAFLLFLLFHMKHKKITIRIFVFTACMCF